MVKKLISKAKAEHKIIKNSRMLQQHQHEKSPVDQNDSNGDQNLQQESLQIEDQADELERSLLIQERALEIVELQRSFAFQVQQQSEMVLRINDQLVNAQVDIDLGTQKVVSETGNYRNTSNWQSTVIFILTCLILLFHFMN